MKLLLAIYLLASKRCFSVSGFKSDPKLWVVMQGTFVESQNVYVCSKQLTVVEDLGNKILGTIIDMKLFPAVSTEATMC